MRASPWKIIKRVFDRAASLDGPERNIYLKSACRNEEIRREVESLLAQHDKREAFPGRHSSIDGRTLSHYEIHERIGEGGVASVFKARDTVLNRSVALKVLQPWAMSHPAARPRLLAEARAASALNHSNIVTVHEVANDGDVWFIVMEYVVGKTLDRWIPSTGLQLREALNFAAQIAEALAAAHTAGIVHGDLKPLNIMVTDDWQVKLLDFGVATAIGSRTEAATALDQFGTKAYMAPEQLQGRRIDPDPRSDIFSFGVVLYQILIGRHPFASGSRAQLVDAIREKQPEPLPARVPSALSEIIERCLDKNPQTRFQSMRDVQSALTRLGRTNRISYSRPRGKLGTASAAHRSSEQADFAKEDDIRHIKTFTQRLGLQNIPRTRQALRELGGLLQNGTSPEIRQAVMPALKEFLQTDADLDGNVIPPSIRELRREALALINSLTQGQLSLCFEDRNLADQDLYAMNFAHNTLSGFSFRRSFVVEADFRGSDLTDTCFAGASVRNANFAGADLSGTDFAGADWFNALGLTQAQLQSVRRDTLLECPATVEAMFRYLANHYVISFDAWSVMVQEQLKATWLEYLRPGGLRQFTCPWRS